MNRTERDFSKLADIKRQDHTGKAGNRARYAKASKQALLFLQQKAPRPGQQKDF
jgi:hypothetical protein